MATKRESDTDFSILPGLLASMVLAVGAWLLVWGLGQMPPPLGQLPLSAILLAVVGGLAFSRVAAGRSHWKPGLQLAQGPILKLAVALIGLRLSLTELGQFGAEALPLVIVIVLFGLLVTLGLSRLMGVENRLATLLALGISICGVSAIAAAAPGLRARPEETGYAIALIAMIGLAAMLLYPVVLNQMIHDPHTVGMLLGVVIPDTAQVTAAAMVHERVSGSDSVLVAATVAKLIRNAGMLVLIPLLVWLATRHDGHRGTRVALPLFIVGFILLSGLRSLGDAWLGSDHLTWQTAIDVAGQFSLFAFTMAVAAMAMTIRPTELMVIGWRPAVAAITASVGILVLAVIWVI